MRRDEKFVANALVDFLGGSLAASIGDGEDPPDFYLSIGGTRIGVEVTRLSQFTMDADGSLGNRATEDSFGLQLIDELNSRFGHTLPNDVYLLVALRVPVSRPARLRKRLTEWVAESAKAPENSAAEKNAKSKVSR